MTFPTFLILVLVAIAKWFVYKKIRRHTQRKIYSQSLPVEWESILKQNVSHYPHIPEKYRLCFHGLINLFLNEKAFIGCDGQAITDEVRLTIAGNVCLLLLNQNKDSFPGFTSILVYPNTYIVKETSYDGLVETQHNSVRAGESWQRGQVVLSWSDVIKGVNHTTDGHNVVIHEFAHKLDEENSIMDGLPVLRQSTDYKEWSEILNTEYQSLIKRVTYDSNSVLDEYGTHSPPEFFAVATESFFEKSKQMKQQLPKLYGQLSQYYGLDPDNW